MTPQKQKFISDWRDKFKGRVFDFGNAEDQEAFFEGVTEMAKHIIHSSSKASIYDVTGLDGVESIYIDARPKKN